MTLQHSSSVVLDSEPPSPKAAPKPRKTYGRPKPSIAAEEEAQQPALDASLHYSATLDVKSKHLEEVAESSDAHGSDDESSDAPKYQYPWRGSLERIDDEYNSEENSAQLPKSMTLPSKSLASPITSSSKKTSNASSPSCPRVQRRFSVSPSPLPKSVFEDELDEDKLAPSTSSSAVPSSPQHAQDTPVTSENEGGSARQESSHSPVLARKALSKRRSSKPLEPTRRKTKIKRPTKKDEEVTSKEAIRLANQRQVSLPRTTRNMHSMPLFFMKLQSAARSSGQQKEHDSDPIESFSSPSTHPPTQGPSILQKDRSSSSIDDDKDGNKDLGDDDEEEFPDASDLMNEARLKGMLNARKTTVLAEKGSVESDDNDSDLEILPPENVHQAASHLQKSKASLQPNLLVNIKSQTHLKTVLFQRAIEDAEAMTRSRQEKWVAHGGEVKDNQVVAQLTAHVQKYTAAGLSNHLEEDQHLGDSDNDDEDYALEEEVDGMHLSGDEEEDHDRTMVDENQSAEADEEEDEQNNILPARRRRAIVGGDSDEEMDADSQSVQQVQQEGRSSSPWEGRSEEEDNKENEHVDDQENAAVRPSFARHGESLHGLENDFSQSLRMPLGTLEHEKPTTKRSFMDQLCLRSDQEELLDSPPRGRFTSLKLGAMSFSQSSQETLHDTPTLQPGFDDLFSDTTQNKTQDLSREDNFARLFGNADRKTDMRDLDLTQDVALQPAVEVDESLKRKAADIFAKEQDLLVEEAGNNHQRKELEVYVNENGFLTQTRPSGYSEANLASQFLSPSPFLPAQRFGSLDSTPTSPSQCSTFKTRFKKRSPRADFSPSVISTKKLSVRFVRSPRPLKPRLGKSEFVEGEAEESDEDELGGFGVFHQTGDEADLDGDDQDADLEPLVDRAEMDEKTLNAEKVQEKAREHQEQDDQMLEKIAKDLTEGAARKKRKRNLGLDSDAEDDEDGYTIHEDTRRRQKMKRQEITDLEVPETRAFAEASMIKDDDDDFFPLNNADVDMDEPQEEISRTELERKLLESVDDDEVSFNPANIAHIDLDLDADPDEEDNSIKHTVVKVIDSRQATSGRRRDLQNEDDDDPISFGREMSIADASRVGQWAKEQKRAGKLGGSSRSLHSAAITGHRNVKAGDGSVRRGATSSQPKRRPPVKMAASVLGASGLDRTGRFA